jgi:hypothetical protein
MVSPSSEPRASSTARSRFWRAFSVSPIRPKTRPKMPCARLAARVSSSRSASRSAFSDGVDGEHVVAGVEVQPRGLLVEPHELDPRRAVLQQVDALLVVLDRRLALALVRQRRADLAVEVGHPLEVLLPAVPVEAVRPHADRLVHAASRSDTSPSFSPIRTLASRAPSGGDGRACR